MARIAFGLVVAASLGLVVWFVATEIESPGLSIAAALIGMPLLICSFALSKVRPNGLTRDAKGAGWVAVTIALLGVGYIAICFGPWLIVACLWFALFIPVAIALVSSPTAET